MKKAIITVLIVIGICAVAVITCPDRQAHKDAIMSVINERINDGLQTENPDYQGLSALFGSIGTGIAGRMIENRLVVKNHFLWSTGEIRDLDGVYQRVSVGVFGHVFMFKKEDIDQAIADAF